MRILRYYSKSLVLFIYQIEWFSLTFNSIGQSVHVINSIMNTSNNIIIIKGLIMKKIIGLTALLLASSVAHAKMVSTEESVEQQPAAVAVKADQIVKGFYVGAGVGSTTFDSDDENVSQIDTHGQTIKLLAGYQFSKVFALEGQYTKYSEIGNSSYTWSPTSLSLSANLGYSFDNGLRPFAIIGFSSLDLDESFQSLQDDSSSAVRYGVGLEYIPAELKRFSLRVGYEIDLFGIDFVDSGSTTTYDYTLEAFYVSAAYKF